MKNNLKKAMDLVIVSFSGKLNSVHIEPVKNRPHPILVNC